MSRYLNSFLMALSFYLCLVAAFIYIQMDMNHVAIKKESDKRVISFSLIKYKEPKKEEPVKKEIQKKRAKPKKIVKKKEPIKTKRVIKKVKKVAEKKRVIKPVKKEKQIKQVVIKKEKRKEIEKKRKKPVVKKSSIQKSSVKKVAKRIDTNFLKQRYLVTLQKSIEKNKAYPSFAQRKHIEGVVKVLFVISKDGKLLKHKILNGKRIFHKATLEAIKKSFPLKPKEEIFTTNLEVKLEIEYKLI